MITRRSFQLSIGSAAALAIARAAGLGRGPLVARSGVGASNVPGGSSNAHAVVGMNINSPQYYNATRPLNDYLTGAERTEYNNGGGWAPLATDQMTNGWPNGQPSGAK